MINTGMNEKKDHGRTVKTYFDTFICHVLLKNFEYTSQGGPESMFLKLENASSVFLSSSI